MKNKYFFFNLVFLVSLLIGLKLFNPPVVNAQSCTNSSQCPPPANNPSGCVGGSASCVNGQCAYTWECNCHNWSAWGACSGGYQTRFCLNTNAYQIQACGASSFMAGTIVSTPEGGKKIEDLKVGDRVISFADDVVLESVVSKTHKVRRDYYFDLTAGGYRVKVTAKHPFYIGNNEFKTAEELTAGDNVYVLEKKSLVKKRVSSKTKVNQKADVYNLTVDGTNTYFAGGFAVHNKGGGPDPSGNRNCPAGTVVDYNQPLDTVCSSAEQGYVVGNATRITGCCREVTKKGACEWVCEWKNNKYVCRKECAPDETTCAQNYYTTYACVPTCDANAWGAWSACSATCGGGTQTRTNACGTLEGRACNTQSCQGPWWQVKDGDITTDGDIISRLPSGKYLNLVGSGGFPGVPVYGDAIGVAPGTISTTLWNANTTTSLPRVFDYSYFKNLIPETIVFNDINKLTTGAGVTVDASGYEWYKITGNLDTVGNIDFGSRKVILFIDGSLNINGNINLTDNQGFFVVFVSGKINIAGTVTSLEGIYDSAGSFKTGVGTSQLLAAGGNAFCLAIRVIGFSSILTSSTG